MLANGSRPLRRQAQGGSKSLRGEAWKSAKRHVGGRRKHPRHGSHGRRLSVRGCLGVGAPFERGTRRRAAQDPSGDCQRSWRAPSVGGAHRSGAAAVVTSDCVLVNMVRVLQAEAQAGAGSMHGGAEFVIVDDDGGGDVDGLEG